MQTLVRQYGVWLTLMLLLGLVGSNLWIQSWQHNQAELIEREARIVREVCARTDWQLPYESDPRWQQLERDLSLDIVPAYSDGLKATDSELVWTQLRWSVWRVEKTVPLSPATDPDQKASELLAVRITRVVEPSGGGLWWFMWLSTIALGSLMGYSCYRKLSQVLSARQSHLVPWVQAVQQEPKPAQLPAFASDDNTINVQLAIVQERVNLWLAQLQGDVERSDLVLGNLREGVLAVDDQSRVLLANAAAQRMLEVTQQEYLYRTLVEVIRVPLVVDIVQRVLDSGAPEEQCFEFGKRQQSLRLIARPLPLGKAVHGALVTVVDESIIRQTELIRRDFVTNASHELKTPLAAIRAYAETLQLGDVDPDTSKQFLGGILSQADRINALINGMLQLARVQSGDAALKLSKFSVQQVLDPCLNAAFATAKPKQIEFTYELPPETVILHSDQDSFQTIASNLLSNAIRYTPESGKVNFSLQRSEDWLIMKVRDTGIGISQGDLSRIFERLYRVEKARSSGSGTGLGLSIVRHLVQLLQGSISVETQPNVGSCFEVRLPIQLSSNPKS